MNYTKLLWSTYLAGWITAIIIAVLFLSGTIESGILSTNPTCSYALEYVSIILTLGAIYTGLKMFKIKKIENDITTGDGKTILKWNVIRQYVLFTALFLDILCFFLTLEPVGNFAAAITALALLFIVPRKINMDNQE